MGLTTDEMAQVFDEWNKGELDSFLIEITRDILKFKDTDGQPLVEKIRDCGKHDEQSEECFNRDENKERSDVFEY